MTQKYRKEKNKVFLTMSNIRYLHESCLYVGQYERLSWQRNATVHQADKQEIMFNIDLQIPQFDIVDRSFKMRVMKGSN